MASTLDLILESFSKMKATDVCFALVLIVIGVTRTETSKDAMRYINSGFVKVLDECKHELGLTDAIMVDLFHFWRLEYDLLNRNTGCVIVCMSKKHELIDSDGKMHHGNAHQFAMAHGADEELATKLVTAIHECEKKNDGIEDECLRVLDIAKCFRTDVHHLNWTPKVEYIVEEILTEV